MPLAIIHERNPKERVYGTFGEVMLRLSPPGFERMFQSPVFNAVFGGGEANVAASLAVQGLCSRFITLLPDNPIGESCISFLRGLGVDCGHVVQKKGSRMGIYFMEKGASQRPSRVIYDRSHSTISEIEKGDIDWNDSLEGCGWFHITGITPALSQNAADAAVASMEKAREREAVVSCDLNYRAKLWKYGVKPKEVMTKLASLSDVIIANEEDVQKSLGIGLDIDPSRGEIDRSRYEGLAGEVMKQFPDVKLVAITLRESVSASHNRWSACLSDRNRTVFSRTYDITHIVDRVGGGDSFCAGLIYGLSQYQTKKEALEYALAASCLAHSTEGDVNLSTVAEIESLMKGDATGRIKR